MEMSIYFLLTIIERVNRVVRFEMTRYWIDGWMIVLWTEGYLEIYLLD